MMYSFCEKPGSMWVLLLSIILLRIAPAFALPLEQQTPPKSAYPNLSLAGSALLSKQNEMEKRENGFIPTIKQAVYGWTIAAKDDVHYVEFATTQENFNQKKADGRVAYHTLPDQGQQGQIWRAEVNSDSNGLLDRVAKIGKGSSEVKVALLQESIRSAHIPTIDLTIWIPSGASGFSMVVMERLDTSLYDLVQEAAQEIAQETTQEAVQRVITKFRLHIPIVHALVALRDAHAAQVANLYIEPQHIMVLEFDPDYQDLAPQWMLVDWGLAHNVVQLEKDTQKGQGTLPWGKGTELTMPSEIAYGPYHDGAPPVNLLLSDVYELAMTHYDTLALGIEYTKRERLAVDLIEDESDARKKQLRTGQQPLGMAREDILTILKNNVPSHIPLAGIEKELELISRALVSQNQGRLTTYEYYKELCALKENVGCGDLNDPRWAMAVAHEKEGR